MKKCFTSSSHLFQLCWNCVMNVLPNCFRSVMQADKEDATHWQLSISSFSNGPRPNNPNRSNDLLAIHTVLCCNHWLVSTLLEAGGSNDSFEGCTLASRFQNGEKLDETKWKWPTWQKFPARLQVCFDLTAFMCLLSTDSLQNVREQHCWHCGPLHQLVVLQLLEKQVLCVGFVASRRSVRRHSRYLFSSQPLFIFRSGQKIHQQWRP